MVIQRHNKIVHCKKRVLTFRCNKNQITDLKKKSVQFGPGFKTLILIDWNFFQTSNLTFVASEIDALFTVFIC